MRQLAFILFAALCALANADNNRCQASFSGDDSDLQEEVAYLIGQLDDSTLAIREEAEEKLLEKGSEILDYLPAISNQYSAEQQQRLSRVRETLERLASEETLKASRITLSATTTLSAALDELETQSGNRVLDFRARFGQQQIDPEVIVEWEDRPYWEALDALLDQAGLTLYPYPGQAHALAFINRLDEREIPRHERASYHDLFRIESKSITATRDLHRPDVGTLALQLEIGWEPRIAPITLLQSLNAISAVDENGQRINVAGMGVLEFPILPNAGVVELTVPLGSASREIKKIATLEGEFLALVPGRIETFDFPLFLERVRDPQRKGGVVITVVSILNADEIYDIRLLIQYDQAGIAFDSHRDWIFRNSAYLIDAEGERIQNVGYETMSQGRNEIGIAYKFILPEGLEGVHLFYQTPVSLSELTIPYTLTDIPLP